MKKVIVALALAAGTITPAMAQSDGPTFTGPRVGISTGWNRGTVKEDTKQERVLGKRSGVAVSGNIGYDAPIGNAAIIGAEIGIGTGGRDVRFTNGASRYNVDPGFTMDATARLGFKPTNNLLIFGKGGWAMQRVKTTEVIGTTTLRDKGTEHGFLWGAGAEVALSKSVALRADFDRVSFNDHYKRTRIMGGVNFRF